MGLFITKRVLSKFYRFPVSNNLPCPRIGSFSGHSYVWFQ